MQDQPNNLAKQLIYWLLCALVLGLAGLAIWTTMVPVMFNNQPERSENRQ